MSDQLKSLVINIIMFVFCTILRLDHVNFSEVFADYLRSMRAGHQDYRMSLLSPPMLLLGTVGRSWGAGAIADHLVD